MAKLKLFRVFYSRDKRERSQTFALARYSNMADEAVARLVARRARGDFIRYESVIQHGQQQDLYPQETLR